MTTNIKQVIAVASGKGGVGKSTVSVNLALSLSKLGKKVGLLDADIYGPSQHIMLGLKNEQPMLNEQNKIIPLSKFDMKIMSFGFFIKAEDAVVWRGPMMAKALTQLINDVDWGDLDILVIDLPPGTGDAQLTITQQVKIAGAVIVSTPQDIALADAIKGVTMFNKLDLPVLGFVENMSYFICPECSHKSHPFSHKGAYQKAKELNVPFLGELPLNEQTRLCCDNGTPIVAEQPDSEQSKDFMNIAKNLLDSLDKTHKTPSNASA